MGSTKIVSLPPSLESFVETLPDEAAARRFAERLVDEHPMLAERLWQRPEVLTWILTLSSYSSWLGETLLQRPEFLSWLEREPHLNEAKSRDDLSQELARMAVMQSTLEPSVLLSRFKRREWVRIYLRDCLNRCSLSEVTEELSHVADVILGYALERCRSTLISRYGTPMIRDERGRSSPATFAVLSLGKLGSHELNYSSDIDLLFLYSGQGETEGGGEGSLRNREFFTRLAENLLRMVGSLTAPEGAAFRIDVRLRPRGRDGALVVPVAEAATYYRTEAQNWERLAMLRARGSAGDIQLAQDFLDSIQDTIYLAEPLEVALRDVRLSKEKIDRKQAERSSGYNVKLGKGGIREIEFIAQALMVCHGGKDTWLRSPQTLIALQRLAEKGHLSETERSQLAEAYTFLRTCEHRIQMEQGAQTHTIPLDEEKLGLLARRMGYQGPYASRMFALALARHRDHVTAIYQRIFADISPESTTPPATASRTVAATPEEALRQAILKTFAMPNSGIAQTEQSLWVSLLESISARSCDTTRVLTLLRNMVASWAAYVRDVRSKINTASSLAEAGPRSGFTTRLVHHKDEFKPWETDMRKHLSPDQTEVLTTTALAEAASFCEAGEFFAQHLTRHPKLLPLLGKPPVLASFSRATLAAQFEAALADCATLSEANAALRQIHSVALLEIGRADVISGAPLRVINLAQTALAEAAIEAACQFAGQYVARTCEFASPMPTWSILGLGRLGHQGIDYGSDLDLIVVYDETAPAPLPGLTNCQAVVKMIETVSSLLTALTADGMLYRVDFRLRPDGRNGPLAVSKSGLLNYARGRAASWEHLAYLKMRPVAGNLEFGTELQQAAREVIFEYARQRGDILRHEVAEIRSRLQSERGGRSPERDFKFGIGAMMDVYFITRYVQMRDGIPDPPEYGTIALIDNLITRQAIRPEAGRILRDGYNFLRTLDHAMRLLVERHTSRLPAQTELLARILKYRGASAFEEDYQRHTKAIRAVYLETFS